jgi:hypothetical protein
MHSEDSRDAGYLPQSGDPNRICCSLESHRECIPTHSFPTQCQLLGWPLYALYWRISLSFIRNELLVLMYRGHEMHLDHSWGATQLSWLECYTTIPPGVLRNHSECRRRVPQLCGSDATENLRCHHMQADVYMVQRLARFKSK